MYVRKRLFILVPLLAVTACANNDQPKYDWGNYSSALVALDADPATAGDYQATLAKIVNDPQGKVPPGIYAEYGYVLQQQGNTLGAIAMYAREKAAWPESALFMDQMIAALQAPAQPKPVS
jgi:hypothetical protein